MAARVPTGIISHARKVCSLYKRARRNIESWENWDLHYRFNAVVLRARFDKNKDIKDLRVAKQLLLEGEEELRKCLNPSPLYFATSVGGCAHDRDVNVPDWVVDYWHPTEKAMYPKYFALREKRKKEYVEFYNKQYPDGQKVFPDHD